MAYRIFIGLIVLACVYFAAETVRFKLLQHAVFKADAAHVLGNPDGDVTIVEFIEYSCIHCRTAHPILNQAIAQDGRVAFIPKPLAAANPDGIDTALLPYAAGKQGKFEEMHDLLMENYRVVNEQVLQDLALELGIDSQQLAEDIKDEDVIKQAKNNYAVFEKYGLIYTPSYAIGGRMVISPQENLVVNDFLNIFNEARGQ